LIGSLDRGAATGSFSIDCVVNKQNRSNVAKPSVGMSTRRRTTRSRVAIVDGASGQKLRRQHLEITGAYAGAQAVPRLAWWSSFHPNRVRRGTAGQGNQIGVAHSRDARNRAQTLNQFLAESHHPRGRKAGGSKADAGNQDALCEGFHSARRSSSTNREVLRAEIANRAWHSSFASTASRQ
jgi:hypothetical protein